MREIKFRAWDKEKKVMVYLDIFTARLPSNWRDFYTPLEYIGLKDKNGKEIYEGDITCRHWDDGASQNGQIIFEGGRFLWQEISQIKFIHPIGINTLHSEVIGNKWDNPELLKEKE